MNRLLIIAILCGIVGLEFAFPNAQDTAHSRMVAHNPGLQIVVQQTAQAEAAGHGGDANPGSPRDNSLFTRLLAKLR